MIRLHVTAEGQTEKAFVSKILAVYLGYENIVTDARCVLTGRDKRAAKQYRGGLIDYNKAKADIVAWMKQDRDPTCRFTTMFDLYALPQNFPGYEESRRVTNPYDKVAALEEAFGQDIDDRRFIPYIQLHEFETLILAAPEQLAWEYLEHRTAIDNLSQMVASKNPELINDGAETAPSKRIRKMIPEYDKVAAGINVVEKIGMPLLLERCRHFSEWLSTIKETR